MKTLFKLNKLALLFLFIGNVITANAQKIKPTVTILNVDSKGLETDAQQLGNILRTEIEKLDTFDVTDRYDVNYLIEKNKLNVNNCYGKMCLLEVAKVIQTDYMITGSVELINQNVLITLRLINVQKQSIEKTTIEEFNNLPNEVQSMVKITARKMFGLTNNEELVAKLTKRFDYENTLNNPNKNRINLEGPRFGYTYLVGKENEILKKSKQDGGYNANPAMFQFGYQFEKQYLNEGNYQALFEFLPMITGVDQQLIIPSLTFLNGFRNNKNGWEIAFGPTVGIVSKMEGADFNGKFYSKKDLEGMKVTDYKLEKRLDSRGEIELTGAILVACGKTIKSGRLNIPINAWATIPNSDGFRIGVSFGYNSKLQ
jgi:TolB-like protein